jgi:acyl-CoA thioester hydrolase
MPDLPPLADNVFDIYRSMVMPAQCDHYGHMNVRWYAHHFDEAGFQIWTVAGVSQAEMRERGIHVVVAKVTTHFRRELVVGTSILIRGGFTSVGDKSVGHTTKMYNADTGDLSAIHETVEVFFNPDTRKPAPMPEDFRARLDALVIDPDAI